MYPCAWRDTLFFVRENEKIFKKTSFLARIDVESVSCYGNYIIKSQMKS